MGWKRVRRSAALVAAAALVVTAGCSVSRGDDRVSTGGGDGADASAFLARSATSTGDVSSMRMKMEMSMSGTGMGMDGVMITAEGAFDSSGTRGSMTMTYGGMFAGMGMDEPMEMVMDGDVVYMRWPMLDMFGVEEGKWARIDAATVSGGGGTPGTTSGPADFLEYLQTLAEVEEIGTEDVDGTSTTHYRAELDLGDLAEEADPEAAERLKSQFEELGGDMDEFPAIPVDVWVDADGLVRVIEMTFDFSGIPGADDELANVEMVQRIEFSAFGEPVEVVVPSGDEVSDADITEMFDD